MENLFDLTLNDYINEISAKKSVPGGGSVVAIIASESVALIQMAVSFSLGKEDLKEHQKELEEIDAFLTEGIKSLKQSALDDIEVFSTYMESEKEDKPQKLKECAKVPVNLYEKVDEILAKTKDIRKILNQGLISDYDLGIKILETIKECSIINYEINEKYIKDQDFIDEMRKKLN